jgi:hypothetical protein
MTSLKGQWRNRQSRSRAVIVAVLCGLASATVASAVPSIGLAASTPRCASSNLRLDKVGESDFTSHRGWMFALRNVGVVTCQLKGYPVARLLGSGAQRMGTRIRHFGGPARTVVLAPWRRGFFAITFAVSGPCSSAVFAYGMRILPPRASSGLVWYAGRFDLCGPAPAALTVSPVAASRRF